MGAPGLAAPGGMRAAEAAILAVARELGPVDQVIVGAAGALSPQIRVLVRLAALLALGASTTTLRWAVELAAGAGADDDALVGVLVTAAPAVGAARVVASAPRLALALGFDIELDGWDGS